MCSDLCSHAWPQEGLDLFPSQVSRTDNIQGTRVCPVSSAGQAGWEWYEFFSLTRQGAQGAKAILSLPAFRNTHVTCVSVQPLFKMTQREQGSLGFRGQRCAMSLPLVTPPTQSKQGAQIIPVYMGHLYGTF